MFRRVWIPLMSYCLVGPLWAADTVTLHYGWTPGIYAKVSGSQNREKFVEAGPPSGTTMQLSYILSTQAHDGGIQIDYSDVVVDIESEDAQLQGWMKGYMEMLSSALPSYVIDSSGQLVGTTGLADLREKMIAGLGTLLVDLPDQQRQQIISGVESIYSEEVLETQLAAEWNQNVGQWIGAQLEAEGVYEAEFETPVPALGNQMVKTRAEFEFAGRVNCDVNDQSQQCVSLLYRSETDSVSVAELLRAMVPAGTPIPDVSVSLTFDLNVVSDPDTLLPYYTKMVKRSSSPVETPNGLITATQTETSEFRYLYVMGNK